MEAYGITLEWPNVENLTYMYIIETVTVANSGLQYVDAHSYEHMLYC